LKSLTYLEQNWKTDLKRLCIALATNTVC